MLVVLIFFFCSFMVFRTPAVLAKLLQSACGFGPLCAVLLYQGILNAVILDPRQGKGPIRSSP